MAAVPAISPACGPWTTRRAVLPAFGSPYQRLYPGYRRYTIKRKAAGFRDLCARGGRPGVEASPKEDIGTRVLKKLPGTQKISRSRDDNVVFVAGATGRVGSRVVRELVKLGFRVRAGVRNVEKAQRVLELAADLKNESEKKKSSGFFSNFSADKLFSFLAPARDKPVELVECDLESLGTLDAALGNAGLVVCSIGASEKEVLDVTGPYRIDFQATANLIEAATRAKVKHFILVSSLGTAKIGWPATALNIFWGVLIWKAKAEKRLQESGVPFTIIRPGGMERPTDAYKETHNLFLAKADTFSGGQVSNLQVAELIASVVSNFELSKNKVIEAVAETSAPLRPIEDMISELPSKVIPSKVAPSGGEVAREAVNQVEAEEKKAELRAEAERRQKLRERYKYELSVAKEEEEKAREDVEAALQEKATIERKASELRLKVEAANLAARQAKVLEEAITAAAMEGRLLTNEEKQKLVASVAPEAKTGILDVKPPNQVVTEGAPSASKSPVKKGFRWPWELQPAVDQPTAPAVDVEPQKNVEELSSEKVAAPEPEVQEPEVVEKIAAAPEPEVLEPKAGEKVVAPDPEVEEPKVAAGETLVQEEGQELAETTTEAAKPEIDTPPTADAPEAVLVPAEAQAEEPQVGQPLESGDSEPVESSASAFTWPWQKLKASTSAVTSEPEIPQPEEILDVNGAVLPEATIDLEDSTLTAEIGSPAKSQSPFARYPDLKPPTSPSPSPPQLLPKSDPTAAETLTVAEEKAPGNSNGPVLQALSTPAPKRPQSPYALYPGLRPPTPPSPSPPGRAV